MQSDLARPVMQFILEQLATGKYATYVEYGCGGSTVEVSQAWDGPIFAVDSHPEWIAKVKQEISNGKLRVGPGIIQHVDFGPVGDWGYPTGKYELAQAARYSALPWWNMTGELLAQPALVLIDGRFRSLCLAAVQEYAAFGSCIVFDDWYTPNRFGWYMQPVGEQYRQLDRALVVDCKQSQKPCNLLTAQKYMSDPR